MRLIYLCNRKGLPTLDAQREALTAAGITDEELAEAWVDRIRRKDGQPQRDYIVGAARDGDEVWVARPGVIATTPDAALRWLARISDHGTVLCIASSGERFQATSDAQAGLGDALRLAAAIAQDERRAALEIARKGKRGRTGGKPRVGEERLEAARPLWFDHRLSMAEVVERTGIASRTMHRHFGKRGSLLFGRAANLRRGK